MQYESTPGAAKVDKKLPPGEQAAAYEKYTDDKARVFRESGLTACVGAFSGEGKRSPHLDVLARTGALLLVNPDTRPTSFFPVGNWPAELEGMSQRMVLSAQANGRHPSCRCRRPRLRRGGGNRCGLRCRCTSR